MINNTKVYASIGEAGYAPISPDSGFSGGGGTACAQLKILVSIVKKIYNFLLGKKLIIVCFVF